MAEPIRATHQLNEMIWKKKPNLSDRTKIYDLTFCDPGTGKIECQMYNLTQEDAKKSIEHMEKTHGLKAFAYPKNK